MSHFPEETSTTNIKMNGTVSAGTKNTVAKSDHVHASDTSKIDTALINTANGVCPLGSDSKVALANLPDSLTGTVATVSQIRQAILAGTVDSNNINSSLSAGTGLSVTLTASSEVPFIVSFANGFNINGDVNYVHSIITNQTFSNLTASTTNYLYIDRASNGTLTYSFSLINCTRNQKAPTAPSTDQHYLNTQSMKMYRWTGSSWEEKNRIFIGKAITDGSTVTSITNYAILNMYDSGIVSTASNSTVNFAHKIGFLPEVITYLRYNSTNDVSQPLGYFLDPNSPGYQGGAVSHYMDSFNLSVDFKELGSNTKSRFICTLK